MALYESRNESFYGLIWVLTNGAIHLRKHSPSAAPLAEGWTEGSYAARDAVRRAGGGGGTTPTMSNEEMCYDNGEIFYDAIETFSDNREIYCDDREIFYGAIETFSGNREMFYGNREMFYHALETFSGNSEIYCDNREVFSDGREMYLGIREIFFSPHRQISIPQSLATSH